MKTAQLEPTRAKEPYAPPSPVIMPATAPARGSHWWVSIIVIAVLAGGGYGIYRLVTSARSGAVDPSRSKFTHDLPVLVAKVRRGDLDQYLVGLGTVTPLNTVTVKSRVDGAITKIWFIEGQKVKAGDRLIDIDTRPYAAALQQAQGQLKKDQASESSAQWNVQQDTIALQDKAIAQQQLHTDTAALDQAKGAIEIDNAAMVTAQLNVDYSQIKSPIDGVVGLKLVDEGNIVHAGETTGLVVITQLQPITVVFTVPEDNIAQVQKRIAGGLPLTVDAYDRDLTRKLASGKVLAIDNQIDPTTGTVKIKAIFDNQANSLYPSQFVNARMLVNTVTDALLVPSAAIQHSPTSTFAYVVVPVAPVPPDPSATKDIAPPTTQKSRASQAVTMRQVVVGPSQAAVGSDNDDTTVVLTGLQPGDVVVTDGVDKLLEGTKVIPTFAETAKRKSATRQSATMESTMQPVRGKHKS